MKKTTILHVITTLNRGGAENQLLILIEEQLKLGYRVSVAALKGNSDLSAEIGILGARVINLTESSFLRQVKTLRKVYSKGYLVHSHLPRAEIVSRLSLFGKRNTWIVSRHNAEKFWPKVPKLLSTLLSRIVTHRTNAVIAISAEVERYLRDSKEISKRSLRNLSVVPYGIPDNSETVPSPKLERFGFCIGIAARLELQKDIPTLIDAFQRLKSDSKHDWTLHIAGSGSLLSQLKQQVHDLGLSQSVTFLGKVQNMDDFYKSIDVFVLSSRYEGFGLVLLEAMLARVPIVSSDIPTSKEVLGENYVAFFPVGDSCELAKVIESMSNPKFRFMACSQYESRLPRFSSKLMANAISRVYQSL
jgi:glycosyltransferase involved in cell wall biosynthesis